MISKMTVLWTERQIKNTNHPDSQEKLKNLQDSRSDKNLFWCACPIPFCCSLKFLMESLVGVGFWGPLIRLGTQVGFFKGNGLGTFIDSFVRMICLFDLTLSCDNFADNICTNYTHHNHDSTRVYIMEKQMVPDTLNHFFYSQNSTKMAV